VIIGVQNKSTLITDHDAYYMAMLVNRQLRDHVAPAWGLLPPSVRLIAAGTTVKCDAIIGLLDDADQAGDLGWHTEGPDAQVYGRVFARPVLDNGGNALTADLSVCSVLSHEAIETLADPACSLWAQAGDGTLYARELADPVESDSYQITVASGAESMFGTVSDFVLPDWFDPDAASGATDWCDLLTAPFEIRPTGYAIVMSGGSVSEQWGEQYPAWRLAVKESEGARTSRRDPSVIPVAVPTSLA